MKKLALFVIVGILLTLLGCVQVDYVGQKLGTLSEDSGVKYFANLQSVPDNYKPIGRASAIFPETYIDEDIDDAFTKKAIEVGANAIARVEAKRVLVGVTNQVESDPIRPTGSWAKNGVSVDGESVYINSFGRKSNLKTALVGTYKLKVDVVFLVTIEKYNEYLGRTDDTVIAIINGEKLSDNNEDIKVVIEIEDSKEENNELEQNVEEK